MTGSELSRIAGPEELRAWVHDLADHVANAAAGRAGVFVGIPRRGVPLAERIAALLRVERGLDWGVEHLDPTLWRDDFDGAAHQIAAHGSPLPAVIDGRRVVLVDDVLWTGRTVRAAMDHLFSLGRPASVELAVLIDRGGREVPIQPDYVAHGLHRAEDGLVKVRFTEVDGEDGVYVQRVNVDDR